jgi:mono/diheme cytochrome c family protein
LCPPALTAAALTLVLCGCGGHSTNQTGRQGQGKAIFASVCTGCHTLTAAANTKPGGDPAIPGLTIAQLATYVRVMPVHLTPGQIDAVAIYLHATATTKQTSR